MLQPSSSVVELLVAFPLSSSFLGCGLQAEIFQGFETLSTFTKQHVSK